MKKAVVLTSIAMFLICLSNVADAAKPPCKKPGGGGDQDKGHGEPGHHCNPKGRDSNLDRIANSTVVDPRNKYKFMVVININKRCAGSLLSPSIVLTAAQCIRNESVNDSTIVHDVSHPVWAGVHDQRKMDGDDIAQRRISHDVIVHDHYNAETKENDIALISLQSPFLFNAYVGAVELTQIATEVRGNITIIGWGHVGNTTSTDLMMEADVKLEDCDALTSFYANLTDSFICGILPENENTSSDAKCAGDEGGPVIFDGNAQVGIIITKHKKTNQVCEGPTTFTNVFKFLDWIDNNTAKLEEKLPKPEPPPSRSNGVTATVATILFAAATTAVLSGTVAVGPRFGPHAM